MRYNFVVLIFALTLGGASAIRAAQLEDGMDAFNRGEGLNNPKDCATAIRLLRPLADRGNEEAQNAMAQMYSDGICVQRDYDESARRYLLSAKQGNSIAQYVLGTMYELGQGVPQNFERAYMWYNLSSASSNYSREFDGGASRRDKLSKRMTAAQISQAQAMASHCKVSGYKNCY